MTWVYWKKKNGMRPLPDSRDIKLKRANGVDSPSKIQTAKLLLKLTARL